MADLATGKTTLSYSGSAVEYDVPEDGIVRVKLWGGAGAGCNRGATAGGRGGGGAYVFAQVPVMAGDVIKFEVARGGQVGVASTTGGIGGWPDGGDSGNSGTVIGGGGGGSTRVYINNVLIAIAAGGGGGSRLTTSIGGAGGADTGENGAGNATNRGLGGTQSAGGGNAGTADARYDGGSLSGGDGFLTGNTITTLAATAGPGGGGGYFGGGAGYNANTASDAGAGGGSSWVDPGLIFVKTGGQGFSAGGTADVDYTSGIAVGGASNSGGSGFTAGGNGQAVAIYETYASAEEWNGSTLTLNYEGDRRMFEITETSTLTFMLWGGGGGGGYANAASPGYGGGGGYVTGSIDVTAGDILIVEVAQGGRAGQHTQGGLGGYPNGGPGGRGSVLNVGSGGGGGSTQIILNGQLIALAAGGAGVSFQGQGGEGGGTTGGTGVQGDGLTVASGTGGTQSAGGIATQLPSDLTTTGGAWPAFGGNGYANFVGSHTVANSQSGGGGGGGYWGGGGGVCSGAGANNNKYAPGGGGSSFLGDALYNDSTQIANDYTPYDDGAVYPGGGIAVGGLSVTGTSGTANHGGDGYAWLFMDVAVPADAEGDIDTITVTPPTGYGSVPADAEGAFLTVNLVAPTGEAESAAIAEGDLGEAIDVDPPSAIPQTEAVITVPINDQEEIFVTAPEAEAAGAGAYVDVPLPVVLVYQPEGEVTIITPGPADIEVDDLPTIVVSTPLAQVLGDIATGDALPTITVTPPEGELTIDGAQEGALPTVQVSPPLGYGGVEGATSVDFGEAVTVTAPEASAQEASDATGGIGTITVTPTEATGAGAANAYAQNQAGAFLRRIFVQEPAAFVASASATGDLGPGIEIEYPTGTADYAVNIAAAMPRRILVNPPTGMGLAGGDVAGFGELPVIYVNPPEAETSTGTAAFVNAPIRTIVVNPPEAEAVAGSFAGDAEGDLPVIVVSPVDGYVEEAFAPLRFARTITPGLVPTGLVERELRLNEADGIMFTRRPDGSTRQTPYLALHRGGLAPAGGTEGEVLAADRTWGAAEPAYDQPVKLKPQAARVVLCDAPLGGEAVVLDNSRVYYRPFFVSKTFTIQDLGVHIAEAADATVHLGVCRWNADGTPGEVVATGEVSGNVAGNRTVSVDQTLTPGHYAAMVAVTGVGQLTMVAMRAPKRLSEELELVGDPSAPFTGDLDDAPVPILTEAEARAFVSALAA